MKTHLAHFKEILHENKEDLMYLFFVGIPSGILMILINPCIDYSHLY